MAGRLTTHVLDTAQGRPAVGLQVELHRIEGEARRHLRTLETNADERTDEPILPEAEWEPGVYELTFHAGAHRGKAAKSLNLVPIRFAMEEPTHYHVPLLLSSYGYSTYRGS